MKTKKRNYYKRQESKANRKREDLRMESQVRWEG